MGPTGRTRIVQLHPTRRCNLSCKHCYSSSSPSASDRLEPDVLMTALEDLSKQGYTSVSISGGEPMVYEPLPQVLAHARRHGFYTTLVSNGMLLSGKRLDAIEPLVDGIVVSLDGKPDSHNRMRNSPRAFETMQKNLAELRHRSIKFVFLFTLTQTNLDELPWVAEFCHQQGAGGLLIHPLELAGNAALQLEGRSPDARESAFAWVVVEQLKKQYAGRLTIALDIVPARELEVNPDQFFLGEYTRPLQGRLSDLLSVLVIEPDGEVVPLQYGFHRNYSLGNLKERRIHAMVDAWRQRTGPALHQLSQAMHASLDPESTPPFINWYERIDAYARQTHAIRLPIDRMASRLATATAVRS